MDKLLRSRLFRCLVCLVLVCCILVNASPIRAKAVTPVALTGWAILALTAALGAGVVLNPATPQIANAIGEELSKTAQRVVPDGWDTIAKVADHLDNMTPEWDPGDFHNDLKTALAGGLLTAITAMTVAAVTDGVVNTEVKEETPAPEGYVYCGDVLIPPLPSIDTDKLPYVYVWQITNNFFQCYAFSKPIHSISVGTSSTTFYSGGSAEYSWYNFDSSVNTDWEFIQSGTSKASGTKFSVVSFAYSNNSLSDSSGNQLSIPSEIKSSTISIVSVPVYPDTYVGDIPQKIQDGEEDPDELNIPIIDPTKIVTSPDTAFQEITQVVQNIKDGTTTYNEFVTNNEYQAVPSIRSDGHASLSWMC